MPAAAAAPALVVAAVAAAPMLVAASEAGEIGKAYSLTYLPITCLLTYYVADLLTYLLIGGGVRSRRDREGVQLYRGSFRHGVRAGVGRLVAPRQVITR